MIRKRPILALLATAFLMIAAVHWSLERAPQPGARSSAAEPAPIDAPGGAGTSLASGASASSARERVGPLDSPAARASGGLSVTGTVTNPQGKPAAGARVELRLTVGEHALIDDAVARTGPDGSYEATFERWGTLPAAACSTLRLSGRAFAPLLSEWRWKYADLARAPSNEPGSDRARLDLRVEPGAMLTGRVLLVDGAPCVGAVVRPRSQDGAKAPWRRSDQRGRYAIPVIESGRFELVATHRGFGVSDPVSAELDLRRDARAPDLVIREGSRLAGIVVYPNGRPAGRLTLEAESTRAEAEQEPGRGLRRGVTETGLDGRFVFHGLLPGEYVIRCPLAGAELTGNAERYAAGGGYERLTVRLHRLRVRVVDAQGRGVPGAELSCSYPRGDGFVSASSRTIISSDGIEFVDLPWLEAPRRYICEAATRSTAVVRRELVIEPGRYETPVEFVLGPPLDTGVLRLTVRGEGREVLCEVKGGLHPSPVRTGGGIDFLLRSANGTRRLEAPAGRYFVTVAPGAAEVFDYFHGSATVELVAGEERELAIELLYAGRLRLRVREPAGSSGRPLSLRELSLRPVGGDAEQRHLDVLDATWLRSVKEDCHDESAREGPWTSRPTPCLRPGLYALHVAFDGCEPVELDVRVRAKVVDVVELQPVVQTG